MALHAAVDADQWRRRLGHINASNLGIVNKTEPRQIGMSEGDERTLVGATKCLLEDSRLHVFLSGELLFTVAYLANRTPHSTLNMGALYKGFRDKEATLQHTRTIGSRASAYIDTRTKNWRTGLGGGRLCVYNPNTEVTSLYDATTNKVVGSGNVVFINTPSMMVSPPTNETVQHRRAGQHRRGGQHRHHQVSRRPRGR